MLSKSIEHERYLYGHPIAYPIFCVEPRIRIEQMRCNSARAEDEVDLNSAQSDAFALVFRGNGGVETKSIGFSASACRSRWRRIVNLSAKARDWSICIRMPNSVKCTTLESSYFVMSSPTWDIGG